MNSIFFPTHNSTLSSQALIDKILCRYNLGGQPSCHFFHYGVNDTYIVKANKEEYFLRVYRHKWRTKEEIESELDLLNFLHKNTISVSIPVKKKDNTYLNRILAPEGIRYAVLFTGAKGSVKRMDNKQSYIYGKLAGKVHVCSDQFKTRHKRFHIDLECLIDAPLQEIKPFLEHRIKDYNKLSSLGKELKGRIKSLLPKAKSLYGICHGDHHGGNVNVDDKNHMTLYDFDCFGYGWRSYDIAVFHWAKTGFGDWSKKTNAMRKGRWNAFLKGYNEERKLTANELEATNYFVPIRHIWLLGLHTQGSETWGRGWINDGYFDRNIAFIETWIKKYKLL